MANAKSPHGRRSSPDGGYGWVIVLSAFSINLIADGITFSFGILLVDLLEQLGESRAATSAVGSVLTGVYHLVGPISAVLTDRFGGRAVATSGAMVSACGFVLSFFATGIAQLCFTFGFLGGIGFGLMYLSAGVYVIRYFDKRRALANGLAICGSGVGTIVFNQVTRILLDAYGWRGTMLIYAGLALNCAVFGLLLFPLPEFRANCGDGSGSKLIETETEARGISGPVPEVSLKVEQKLLEFHVSDIRKTEDAPIIIELKSMTTDERYVYTDCLHHIAHSFNTAVEEVSFISDALCKKQEDEIGKSDISNECTKISKKHWRLRLGNVCNSMFSFDLLRDTRCLFFLGSAFVLNLAFTIPYNLLPDQAVEENGMSKQEATWIISTIGIANTLSRIFLGWVGDRACVNRMWMMQGALFMAGLSTALSPLLISFATKLVYSCLIGAALGGYVMLVPVVLADMFGADVISRSLGLVLFVVGVAGFVSTPIGGWLFDRTGSYTFSFIVAGAEFIVAGALLLVPKCLNGNRT